MKKKAYRHLVVAPHHDDEVIGCGGTIAQAVSQGDQVTILIVTSGSLSGGNEPLEQMIKNREDECIRACTKLGVKKEDIKFLRKKDRSLVYSIEFVEEIVKEINESQANIIYYPHSNESDRDHRIVHEVVKEAVFLCQSGFLGSEYRSPIKMCLQYEVWTPMKKYHIVKNITDFVELKKASMEEYQSQLTMINLAEGIAGLNAYRGMQTGVKSAEVFQL